MDDKYKIIYKMYLEFSDAPALIDLTTNRYAMSIQVGMAAVGHDRKYVDEAISLLKQTVLRKNNV